MMTESRFEYLLGAYGTRWNAWPDAEREAARALLAQSEDLQALWAQEDALDGLLSCVPAPMISASLREVVIASAAGAGLRRRRSRGWAWLSGAGVAATACAGAAFGMIIAHQINNHTHADNVLYQASLTSADDTEVLGFEMASLDTSGR